jgi:hypothetical protein
MPDAPATGEDSPETRNGLLGESRSGNSRLRTLSSARFGCGVRGSSAIVGIADIFGLRRERLLCDLGGEGRPIRVRLSIKTGEDEGERVRERVLAAGLSTRVGSLVMDLPLCLGATNSGAGGSSVQNACSSVLPLSCAAIASTTRNFLLWWFTAATFLPCGILPLSGSSTSESCKSNSDPESVARECRERVRFRFRVRGGVGREAKEAEE